MTQLIPTDAPTVLPDGRTVPSTTNAKPQPGTTPIPRTGKGSGVYGGLGSMPTPPGPVRDYVVRLHNDSPKPFRMRYLTVEYLIQPDDDLVVPWEVMVSFLGSPDTQNYGPRRMDRKNVYEKLRVKYGAYWDDDLWEQNKPHLSAYRVTGEKLITVVDDPDGLATTPSVVSQQQAMAANAQLEMLQQQVIALSGLVEQLTGQASNPPGTVQSDAQSFTPPTSPPTGPPQDAPEAPEWTAEMAAQAGNPGESTPPMHPGPIPPVSQPDAAMQPPPPVPHMTPQMQPQPVSQPGAAPTLTPPGSQGGATVDTPTNPVRVT